MDAEKLLEQVREKYPHAVLLQAGSEVVIVVSPTRAVWRRFKSCIADERKKPDAYEVLLRDCVVHPDGAGLEALLERKPALAEVFGDKLCELAGAGVTVDTKG